MIRPGTCRRRSSAFIRAGSSRSTWTPTIRASQHVTSAPAAAARWPDAMRAIEVRRFGAPDVLEIADLADPTPGPEQVVVASSASDVLFVDTMIRSGAGA